LDQLLYVGFGHCLEYIDWKKERYMGRRKDYKKKEDETKLNVNG
jgi:hypothetical protein